jgi:hypothetical protein
VIRSLERRFSTGIDDPLSLRRSGRDLVCWLVFRRRSSCRMIRRASGAATSPARTPRASTCATCAARRSRADGETNSRSTTIASLPRVRPRIEKPRTPSRCMASEHLSKPRTHARCGRHRGLRSGETSASASSDESGHPIQPRLRYRVSSDAKAPAWWRQLPLLLERGTLACPSWAQEVPSGSNIAVHVPADTRV